MDYWTGSVSQWPSDRWIFSINSSPASDHLSDEIFPVNHIFFVPKLLMRESRIGKINPIMDRAATIQIPHDTIQIMIFAIQYVS